MTFDWITAELRTLEEAGRRRERRVVVPVGEGGLERDGRRLINLAGNDYLNLAADPRVTDAAKEAITDAGFGARASPLVAGRTPWHEALERRLAEFEQANAALLFPSGYAANMGTIAALVDREDSVFCDRLNHASLIDGCRLSGARFHLYRHLDVAALEGELRNAADRRRRLIVTDSVFSMDGDVAPLRALVDLAERYDAMLLVDEAHATGVLGAHGRGLVEFCEVPTTRLVRVGTLSKALGGLGGFVVGPQPLIDWLWNKARPQVFSTALPPAVAAAAMAALDLVDAEPERRVRLRELSIGLREKLRALGLTVPVTEVPTPIVPIILGDEARTVAAAAKLEEAGFLVAAIRPTTVPAGTSRLRVSLHCDVTAEQLGAFVEALGAAVV